MVVLWFAFIETLLKQAVKWKITVGLINDIQNFMNIISNKK